MSILLSSEKSASGRRWQLRLEAGTYSVIRVAGDGREWAHTCPSPGFATSFKKFTRLCSDDGLVIDWDSAVLAVGASIVVQSEIRGQAREVVGVFHSQADYDEFRKDQLALYPDHYDDAAEVARLLEVGDVDAAWEVANSDDDDGKVLWETAFGSHFTTCSDREVKFTDLPDWIRTLVTESANHRRLA